MNIAIPSIPTRRTTQNTGSQTSARLSGLSRGLLSLALVSLISACSTTAPSRQGKYKGKTPQNVSVAAGPNRDVAVYAMQFLGTPYRYGGNTPDSGFDCSGLTMTVYQLNGLDLPRHSRTQYDAGDSIAREDLQKGDLVFFDTRGRGKVSHVGIYIGAGRFIHAPSSGKKIRIDALSSDYYARRFVGAKTYL